MKTNKNPLQRQNSPFNRSASRFLQRATLWVIAAGAVAFQVSGCNLSPPPSLATTPVGTAKPGAVADSRFSGCRQFFASGQAPMLPKAPLLREICYDDFVILHTGQTRTPVFVAQRLNRESIQDARCEQRTDKFFS